MMILFPALGVLVVLIAAYVITGLYVTLPTKGKSITGYGNPKSALLVIDVQNDITNNKSYSKTSEFVDSVNRSIEFAEKNAMEILYIKNIYGSNPVAMLLSGGKGKKGTEGVEFDSRLNIVNDNVFTKSRGDSFSSAEFKKYLISKKVESLYIAGADAAGCILRTAQGGRNREYNVTIIKDAIITAANDTKMKQLKEQYKKYGIDTITLNELCSIYVKVK